MLELESGKDKVKKICDVLRKETLDPARGEAHRIIEDAQTQSEKIIAEAEARAASMIADAKAEIEKMRSAFHSSQLIAGRQVVTELKHQIEKGLFHDELKEKLQQATKDPHIIAQMITALLKSIEQGREPSELTLTLPTDFPKEALFNLLTQEALNRFAKIEEGTFIGGAKIKLEDQNLVIDMTDETLLSWLCRYLRNDFRDYLFHS